MAIEVKTFPDSQQSVFGDLLYIVYEATKANDPVTYPDYRYLADIYVGADYVTRVKSYPDPTNKMGIFNLGSIFKDYITPSFNPDLSLFEVQQMGNGEFNISGTVWFGEEYGFTQFPATIFGVGQKFYGHYNGRLIGISSKLNGTFDDYASYRPRVTSIYRGTANAFIPYYKPVDLFSAISVTVTTYDVNDNVLGTSSFSLPFILTPGNLRIFNIGTTGIGTVLPITESVDHYTIDADGDLIRVNLICEPKFTTYTLHFLNSYGGFESRDFTKISRKLLDIEKKDFGKLPYTVNASGEVSYYNSNKVYNETRTVYASQYKEKMTLNTDIMTDAEYTWLGDLVLSPMVFIEIDGYFIPTVIVRNNYEFKKTVNDKTSNLTIDIEFGEQFNAQYR